ncbi:MAG: hypothetical protein JWL80_335 [Parcubacteria group bacterium]|nr:hypothetical protein [Parcubacteria group bacterium]
MSIWLRSVVRLFAAIPVIGAHFGAKKTVAQPVAEVPAGPTIDVLVILTWKDRIGETVERDSATIQIPEESSPAEIKVAVNAQASKMSTEGGGHVRNPYDTLKVTYRIR